MGVKFPLRFLATLVQWYELHHSLSLLLIMRFSVPPNGMAGIQIVCIAEQHHFTWQFIQCRKDTLLIPLSYMAENDPVWRTIPRIFLSKMDPHLVLDKKLVSQVRTCIHVCVVGIQQ